MIIAKTVNLLKKKVAQLAWPARPSDIRAQAFDAVFK